jgi:hypothetical protein
MIRSRSKTRLVFLQIGFCSWGALLLGLLAFLWLRPQGQFALSQLPLISIALWLAGIGFMAFLFAGYSAVKLGFISCFLLLCSWF